MTPVRHQPLALLALALTSLLLSACSRQSPDQQWRTDRLSTGDIAETVSASGQLSPVTLVSVGTQVSGIVQTLFADFNDRVQAGQVLLQLDDALLKAQLTQSQANLASAQAGLRLARNNWQRLQPLASEGFASQQEMDQAQQALSEAEARVAQARAQVHRDQTNLDFTIIRSPVSGVVVLRAVDVGQTVAASFQTPELYQIAEDLSRMHINAYFTESDIGRIREGQKARFRVDAYPERAFQGVVQQVRLSPRNEQNVITYDVVIAVDNPDGLLLPGMTASVTIVTREQADVLRVPTAALRFRPPGEPATAGSTVWIRDGQQLRPVRLQLGISDRRYSEIVEVLDEALRDRLQAGSEVIVASTGGSDASERGGSGMRFRLGP